MQIDQAAVKYIIMCCSIKTIKYILDLIIPPTSDFQMYGLKHGLDLGSMHLFGTKSISSHCVEHLVLKFHEIRSST